jgi:hypothetical protein
MWLFLLDAAVQISPFGKLKLTNCARPETPRRVLFCLASQSIEIPHAD